MSWSFADTVTKEGGDMDDKELDALERNLKLCPFCLGRPHLEDAANSDMVYISCDCGAQMKGYDWNDVVTKWSNRKALHKNTGCSKYRESWTGW